MTVKELHNYLSKFDYCTEVKGTYEGIITPIEVYQDADGTILIDCDGGYKIRHQKIKCETCGEQAVHAPFNNRPVCYEHWNNFKEK